MELDLVLIPTCEGCFAASVKWRALSLERLLAIMTDDVSV